MLKQVLIPITQLRLFPTEKDLTQVSGCSRCRARTSKRRKFVMRPKCVKHGVFVGLNGCKFCNLPANNVASTGASPPHSDACGSLLGRKLHVGDSNQSSAYDVNAQEKLPCPSFCEKCSRTNTSLCLLNLVQYGSRLFIEQSLGKISMQGDRTFCFWVML